MDDLAEYAAIQKRFTNGLVLEGPLHENGLRLVQVDETAKF